MPCPSLPTSPTSGAPAGRRDSSGACGGSGAATVGRLHNAAHATRAQIGLMALRHVQGQSCRDARADCRRLRRARLDLAGCRRSPTAPSWKRITKSQRRASGSFGETRRAGLGRKSQFTVSGSSRWPGIATRWLTCPSAQPPPNGKFRGEAVCPFRSFFVQPLWPATAEDHAPAPAAQCGRPAMRQRLWNPVTGSMRPCQRRPHPRIPPRSTSDCQRFGRSFSAGVSPAKPPLPKPAPAGPHPPRRRHSCRWRRTAARWPRGRRGCRALRRCRACR
jgi:hypothetical protein